MIDSGMVKVDEVPENTGATREYTEIDTNEYLNYKAEGDDVDRGIIQQGYSKTMYPYRVGENLGVTYEMRTQNKYPQVYNMLFGAGKKGYNSIDLDLTHRLTFGTAVSYTDRKGRTIATTCGDSLQLNNRIAEVKSILINGENLKRALWLFMATLRNLYYENLQRLNEWRQNLFCQAIVRTA